MGGFLLLDLLPPPALALDRDVPAVEGGTAFFVEETLVFGTLTLAAKGLTTGGSFTEGTSPLPTTEDESFHPPRAFFAASAASSAFFIRREMTCSRGCGSGGACSSTQGA